MARTRLSSSAGRDRRNLLKQAGLYGFGSEKPGWGIEVDEAWAATHPITDEHPNATRTKDGSVIQGAG